MTTPIMRLRQSPSGKPIGHPALTVGPGSLGLIFRAHGAGVPQSITTATAAVNGLSDVAVTMRPGYLYELALHLEAVAEGLTSGAQFSTYYAVRDQSTGVWTAYAPIHTGTHVVNGAAGTYESPGGTWTDELYGVSVTTVCDRIRFGVYGDGPAAAISIYPVHCWARVSEYMP